ncbi:MAG: siroheme decarboxylase subunit alpha [Methanomethylovorans sp.]|uniref:siroheme decarboxylase subunit alpha n=1 Tax=Methanomethylovorans sp. TaxID=2758717 RepID=UPI000B1B503F|nr:siroheme decarboxylase subunit alpha [Methanomethylovorans sp.]
MIQLDKIDKKLLNLIQLDFPLDIYPFRILADKVGISEDEVIKRMQRLKEEGAIRRIGPIINSRNTGLVGTLVALKVPEDRTEQIAELINSYPEVSHNYLRPGDYNLWFTLSAPNSERLQEILEELRQEAQCPMMDLPTIQLFKIGVKFKIK